MEYTRDDYVFEVQNWVNQTYGDIFIENGYDLIDVDGSTGWDVVNSLIMGLQIELGISKIAPTFGEDTIDAMNAYGPISSVNSSTRLHVIFPDSVLQIV